MKDIMSSPVIVGKIDDTIKQIATLMKEHNIGFLPIAKEHKIVGVMTDRDLVIGPLSNCASTDTSIENYITHNVIFIESHQSIDELLDRMATYQVKRMLVVENQKIIGVISLSDILRHVDSKKLIKTLVQIDQNQTIKNNDDLEIDSFYL